MATFVFTDALGRWSIDDLVVADVRALLTRTANNVSQNPDVSFLSELALDEYDGLNYARVQLTSLSKVVNTIEKRVELHADNPVFPSLAPATFPAGGILFYVHAGADTANRPLTFVDKGGFPKNGNGLDFEFLLGSAGVYFIERMAA